MTDVVVLIDRQQGGEAHLASQGMKLHTGMGGGVGGFWQYHPA